MTKQIRTIEMTNAQRSNSVIPSEVENEAAGEAATWTGRPEAERTGSERINSLIDHQECLQPSHEATAWQATSLDMTLH
jgi:hypothetical protein